MGALDIEDPFTNCTVTPPKDVESGIVSAAAVVEASWVPKMVISDPGVMGLPFWKLAPFNTPPAATTGVWAAKTPQPNNSVK
jgi:hypothetical protein